MTEITFRCPNCRRHFATSSAAAGSTLACPGCDHILQLDQGIQPTRCRQGSQAVAIVCILIMFIGFSGWRLMSAQQANPNHSVSSRTHGKSAAGAAGKNDLPNGIVLIDPRQKVAIKQPPLPQGKALQGKAAHNLPKPVVKNNKKALQPLRMEKVELNPFTLNTVDSGHKNTITDITFSPDGKLFATASNDWQVKIWHTATRKHLKTLTGLEAGATCVRFSPDGKFIAAGSRNGAIIVWDAATGKKVKETSDLKEVLCLVFTTPDTIYFGASHPLLGKWDWKKGKNTDVVKPLPAKVTPTGLERSHNGKELALIDRHGLVLGWNVKQNRPTGQLRLKWANGVALSSDGNLIATCSTSRFPQLLDRMKQETQTLPSNFYKSPDFSDPVFSADSSLLACVNYRYLVVWKRGADNKWQKSDICLGHEAKVTAKAFSPNNHLLVSGDDKRQIRFWDVSLQPEHVLDAGKVIQNTLWGGTIRQGVGAICFSEDSQRLLVGSRSTMTEWDVTSGKQIRSMEVKDMVISCIGYLHDKASILAADHEHAILLQRQSGQEHIRWEIGNNRTSQIVTLSPDGKTLATSSFRSGFLWDVATQKVTKALPERGGFGLAFTPDSKKLAVSPGGQQVTVYDLQTNEKSEYFVAEFRLQGSRSTSSRRRERDAVNRTGIAFSPDRKLFAATDRVGRVYVYLRAEKKQIARLEFLAPIIRSLPPNEFPVTLAFSPDSRLLAIGTTDLGVYLWDVRQQKMAAKPRGHVGGISQLAFSPDGTRLAVGGYDGTVKLWRVP